VVDGRFELPPMANTHYAAFIDPSGGSSDSVTLAVVHREGQRGIVDAVREARQPFSEAVVAEFATLLKTYRIRRVLGDRFAGLWPRERFQVHGIEYDASARPKSDLYRDLLPIVNGARCELLDHPKLVAQLCALERRVARGGRDSIDHPPGQHDDIANAIAGCLTNLIVIEAPRPTFGVQSPTAPPSALGTWGCTGGVDGARYDDTPAAFWRMIGDLNQQQEGQKS
jgi:hypothetical protein